MKKILWILLVLNQCIFLDPVYRQTAHEEVLEKIPTEAGKKILLDFVVLDNKLPFIIKSEKLKSEWVKLLNQFSPHTFEALSGEASSYLELTQQAEAWGVLKVSLMKVDSVKKSTKIGLLKKNSQLYTLTLKCELWDAFGRVNVFEQNWQETLEEGYTDFSFLSANRDEPTQSQLVKILGQLIKNHQNELNKEVEKLGWQGIVSLVEMNRLYIEAPMNKGIQVGDVVKIKGRAYQFKSNQENNVELETSAPYKGTAEIMEIINKNTLRAKIQSGGRVQKGDGVTLY